MISKKLIHFNTYLAFEDSRSQLYDWSIAFIAETKQIYTHGNFYDCNIEDINELNDKIDEILSDIYIEKEYDAPNGVYIVASDGTLTTEADWDSSKAAVGVAVIDDAASFIIGLNHTTLIPWGTDSQGLYSVDISGLTNYLDATAAATDMNGIANTDVITAIYSGTDCAAGYAKSQSIICGDGSLTGYLGSAGEWLIVLNNHEAVKSAIATAGGTAFQTTDKLYYWTSTEYSSTSAWLALWYEDGSDWDLLYSRKYDSNRYRLSVPFYPPITKQSLKDKLAELEQSIPTKVSELENDVPYVVDDVTPENGVYAVAADGSLVSVDEADESCIGVALIVNDADTPQHIMIEKNGEANTTSIQAAYTEDGATDTSYKYFYWGPYNKNVGGIIDWIGGDISSISTDYKTWKNDSTYAWNDYDGKANTAALIHVTNTDIYDTYANAATYCVKFNETETENQGYTDWYIPACGQLSLIYINLTDINVTLTKIGGTTIDSSSIYWSSSEYSILGGWYVDFPTRKIRQTAKRNGFLIRFIRDIPLKPVKDRISTLESTKQNTLVSGTNIKTINGGSILGSGNMTISKIGTSTVGSTTQPIYLSSGTPTVGSTYAGGTAVTLNGSSKASSTASFYAPTYAGTSGYVLTSSGSGAPSWRAPFSVTTVTRNSSTSSISLTSNSHTIVKSYGNSTINCTASTTATSGLYEECLLTIYNYHSSSAVLNITDDGNAVTWINYEDLAANSTYLVSISNGIAIMVKTAIEAVVLG